MFSGAQEKLMDFVKICQRLDEADQALGVSISRFSKQEMTQTLEYKMNCAREIELNASTCSNLLEELLIMAPKLNLEWSHLKYLILSSIPPDTVLNPDEMTEKFAKTWNENIPQMRTIFKLPESQTEIPSQPPLDLLRAFQTIRSPAQMPDRLLSDGWIDAIRSKSKEMRELARIASTVNEVPTLQCPQCGAELKEKQRFCTNCGHAIQENRASAMPEQPRYDLCQQCGAPLKPGKRFCTNCGAQTNAQGGREN